MHYIITTFMSKTKEKTVTSEKYPENVSRENK